MIKAKMTDNLKTLEKFAKQTKCHVFMEYVIHDNSWKITLESDEDYHNVYEIEGQHLAKLVGKLIAKPLKYKQGMN